MSYKTNFMSERNQSEGGLKRSRKRPIRSQRKPLKRERRVGDLKLGYLRVWRTVTPEKIRVRDLRRGSNFMVDLRTLEIYANSGRVCSDCSGTVPRMTDELWRGT